MKTALPDRWKILILIGITFMFGCNEDNPMVGPDPTPLPAYFDHPAWHPDGEWIAVEHADDIDADGDGKPDRGFAGIWLVHAVTGEKQPLISGFGLPAWSPDGKKLALMQSAQIFTIEVNSLQPARVDTNSLVQLTTEGRNFYPDWSPDGEWIAYDSNHNTPNGMNFIWKMKVNGSEKTRITFAPEMGEIRQPNWSPAGDIVHIRYLVGVFSSEIFTMNSNGQSPRRLTENEASDLGPKYSPDGTKIAFYSQRSGPSAIWVMNSDGSSARKVSPDYVYRFDWSPDGKKFVFLYWEHFNPRRGNGQLWLINTDGSGLRQLTHFSR